MSTMIVASLATWKIANSKLKLGIEKRGMSNHASLCELISSTLSSEHVSFLYSMNIASKPCGGRFKSCLY